MLKCLIVSLYFLFQILDEEITPTMQKLQEVRSLQNQSVQLPCCDLNMMA